MDDVSLVRATGFVGGGIGRWQVIAATAVKGEPLPAAACLDIQAPGAARNATAEVWRLRGSASNVRYATRSELSELRSKQEALGRAGATMAALIPIKKSAEWWELAQDERRAIFEEASRHTAIGMSYLPAVARQLYHARDLGEPFDFLTWFEFAPADAPAFDDLVGALRVTEEWRYVEREIDIRLRQA